MLPSNVELTGARRASALNEGLELMVTCTYDNPKTMCRECWQNGVLICHYSAALFELPVWPLPVRKFFFGANIGDWKTGQMVGDSSAMSSNVK